MDNFNDFTNYAFELVVRLIECINSNFLLQFGVLLVFCYFAVSVLRKFVLDDDNNNDKGVKL